MDDRATFDKMFNEWYAQFVYFAYYFINPKIRNYHPIHD